MWLFIDRNVCSSVGFGESGLVARSSYLVVVECVVCLCVVVEADDDVEECSACSQQQQPEVSMETQLSIYMQLQTQLFQSVVSDPAAAQHRDEADVRDLINRFSRLQDRQMKIISAIQESRYTAQQVSDIICAIS